jgi:RecJ-like exonuclease
MGKSGVGLAIVIGDRGENLEEAHNILDKYRQNIAKSLEWIFKNKKLVELEYIYVIRAEDNIDDTIIGVVSSVLLSQGTLNASKPIISTAFTEDNQMKVSARSTEDLNNLGLHIGKVLQEAAEIFEGGGGGHDIAAGAYIPLDKENLFIEKVNQLVREKVKN